MESLCAQKIRFVEKSPLGSIDPTNPWNTKYAPAPRINIIGTRRNKPARQYYYYYWFFFAQFITLQAILIFGKSRVRLTILKLVGSDRHAITLPVFELWFDSGTSAKILQQNWRGRQMSTGGRCVPRQCTRANQPPAALPFKTIIYLKNAHGEQRSRHSSGMTCLTDRKRSWTSKLYNWSFQVWYCSHWSAFSVERTHGYWWNWGKISTTGRTTQFRLMRNFKKKWLINLINYYIITII